MWKSKWHTRSYLGSRRCTSCWSDGTDPRGLQERAIDGPDWNVNERSVISLDCLTRCGKGNNRSVWSSSQNTGRDASGNGHKCAWLSNESTSCSDISGAMRCSVSSEKVLKTDTQDNQRGNTIYLEGRPELTGQRDAVAFSSVDLLWILLLPE